MRRFVRKHPNIVLGFAGFWLAIAPMATYRNVAWFLECFATSAWQDLWQNQQGLFGTATGLCFPVGLIMLITATLRGVEERRSSPPESS